MKSFLLALVMMALAGCATQATIYPSAPGTAQIAAEQGAVAFRLTVGGPGVSQYFSFWDKVRVKGTDTGKNDGIHEIWLSTLGAAGSATYFGALPDGGYQVEGMSSERCGAICIRSSAWFGDTGPGFRVEKGKLTYLGNLIYLTVEDRKSGLIAKPVNDSENFRLWLQTYYPNFASMPLSEQAGTFERNEAIYRAAQNYTSGYLHGAVLPQGSVLFHNLSGSLRKVDWPARARTINTGVNSRIQAVLPLTDEHWVVAADFGEVRETSDGGATWRDIQPNLPEGALRGLYSGKDGDLLIFMEQYRRLDVYAGRLGGPWKRLWSDAFEHSFIQGGIVSPLIQPNDDRSNILVLLPGQPAYRLDTRDYARTEFELPGGVIQAAVSGDGVIRCRCNRTGMWVSTWESRDGGKNWQDSELSRYLPLPHFKDKQNGFNTRDNALVRTTDGGKTWAEAYVQERPYWPYPMQPYAFDYVFVDARRIVATDTIGTLIASDDGGMSWAPVRHTR